MSEELLYEKVDSQNIRIWKRTVEITNRNDLLKEKADIQSILALSRNLINIIIRLLGYNINGNDYEAFIRKHQGRVEEIDALLSVFNNRIVKEEIDFIER